MQDSSQIDTYREGRRLMVEEQLRNRGIRDERVLEAMARVPRHEFVCPELRDEAYEDHPIAIGEGQTISQPFVVADMLEALALRPEDVVLEVGTGSGYETAVLAELVGKVYSIERIASLAERARVVLERLGYRNVTVVHGDGSQGLPEAAPFDAIVVSAAAPHVPRPLLDQLRDGGRLVIPVGSGFAQELQLVRKIGDRNTVLYLDGVRFVPLIGRDGFREAD
ncbi:MAG TPA: protein-L-isoaspartate(D-aspartate) O-methyltransferase [Terriglobales bacterium]|jgi:protein-L-isoaspartate(D-aspartate) O-methyltransferase|nr:protein-L-isoaspartate(D-aspartate) O-methyltransferase [Terriglobales bacterium]